MITDIIGRRRAALQPPPANRPPLCNTGAENLQTSALIDYIRITFDEEFFPLVAIFDLLQIEADEWIDLPFGRQGYEKAINHSGITILFGGDKCLNKKGHRTIHLDVTGSGCRHLEGRQVVGEGAKYSWEEFLGLLWNLGTFTRLDLALDERAGVLSIDKIQQAWKDDNKASKFKELTRIEKTNGRGESSGATLNIGNRQSRCFVRIYDKAKEQEAKKKEVSGPWVRVEMECKDERAQALAITLSDNGLMAGLKVLLNYLDFRHNNGKPDKRDWARISWWATFIDAFKGLRLACAPEVWSIERVEQYIRGQAAPSIALLWAAAKVETTCDGFDYFLTLVREGKKRWKKKHKLIAAGLP